MKKIAKRILALIMTAGTLFSAYACTEEDYTSSSGANNAETSVSTEYNYDSGIDYTKEPMTLVENGEAKYTVVVSKTAPSSVLAVANELNTYVKQSTGVELPIVDDEKTVTGKYISIGDTKQFKDESGMDVSKIQNDGYHIKSVNGNTYINAPLARGVKFGVYTFLERFLGVRWLTDTVTHVPQTAKWQIYPHDILEEPVYKMRWWMGGATYLNNTFFNHCKYYEGTELWLKDVNTNHNATDSHGNVGYVNKTDPDPEDASKTLRETHPEFFSDYTNKMLTYYDLCYTSGVGDNGEFIEGINVASLMVEKIKTFLSAPRAQETELIMIGRVDDRTAVCKCEKCEERRNKFTESGIQVMFVNVVESQVNAWLRQTQNREITFVTFAYQATQTPPVLDEKDKYGNYVPVDPLVKCNENVAIRIAPIDANYTYSFNDERQEEEQRKIVYGWSAVADTIMIWDYVSNYVEYWWYFPNMYYLKENLQTYKDIGAIYVMNQSSYTQNQIWHDDMRNYVASRLYWNLNWNVEYLINEYIELYYGVASENVKDIVMTFEHFYGELRETNNFRITLLSEKSAYMTGELYPIEFLNLLMDKIDTAIYEVNANETLLEAEKSAYARRLLGIRLTPMRMLLRNYTSYYALNTRIAYATEYFDIIDDFGITALGEHSERSVASRRKEVGLA